MADQQNISEYVHMEFTWYDYTFFSLMLGSSALIGIYFGFFGNKQSSAKEYLLGGKEMNVTPIAISLVASTISGITLLAVPTDIYRYGVTYWFYVLNMIPIYFLVCYVFFPIFDKLQLNSTFEYFMLRFDRKIRILSSFLNTFSTIMYLPIVIYIPALAFAQATGVNIHLVTPIVCGVCIFYTTIGGLKTVVWTDTLQFVVMIASTLAVFYLGLESVGGFKSMWMKSAGGQRLDVDLDLDPTKRDALLPIVLGSLVGNVSYICVGQGCVQKYLALPNRNDVKKALIIFCFGLFGIVTIVVLTGLIMYAKYADCDPYTARKIIKHDQILPFYVMDVATSIPGLSGLFMSGLFSAALSTLSASMNSLACSVYEDFLSPLLPKDMTQKKVSNILKLLVFLIGVISTLLVFVVENFEGMLPLNISLQGITSGPLIGLFTLGMLIPKANAKGALFGGLGSLLCMSYLVIKSQLYQAYGTVKYFPKPVSVAGCNETIINLSHEEPGDYDEEFSIFKITFWYYPLIGGSLVFLIGIPISYFTQSEEDSKVNEDLISPISHWMIPKEKGKYLDIKKALNVINEKS